MNKVFLPLIFFTACFMQASRGASEEATPHIVSMREYCSILNAMGADDSYQLYRDGMASDYGIVRTETERGYDYHLLFSKEEDQPILGLNRLQQELYCNWVGHGRPMGEENVTTTEDGTYKLDGIMEGEGVFYPQSKCYLVAGENPEMTLILDMAEQASTSPLMMFGEDGKEDPEKAKEKLVLEQQQRERDRQVTAIGDDRSSSSWEHGNKLPGAIEITTPSDDLSELTSDETTQARHQQAMAFSPKGVALTRACPQTAHFSHFFKKVVSEVLCFGSVSLMFFSRFFFAACRSPLFS